MTILPLRSFSDKDASFQMYKPATVSDEKGKMYIRNGWAKEIEKEPKVEKATKNTGKK